MQIIRSNYSIIVGLLCNLWEVMETGYYANQRFYANCGDELLRGKVIKQILEVMKTGYYLNHRFYANCRELWKRVLCNLRGEGLWKRVVMHITAGYYGGVIYARSGGHGNG